MKYTYTYKFVDGAENEIEVSPELAAVLEEFDCKEKSNDRRETRRHTSLYELEEEGFLLQDFSQDIDLVLESQKKYREAKYLEKLQKQVFAKYLTEKQADIFYRNKILQLTKVMIAKDLNVTEGAIRKHILKAEERMEMPLYKVSRMFGAPEGQVYEDEIIYEDIDFLKCFLRLK